VAASIQRLHGLRIRSLFDELAPGWADPFNFGFGENGPWKSPSSGGIASDEAIEREAEIGRRLAPYLDALRAGTIEVVGAEGPVSRSAWFAGGWTYAEDRERRVDWLQLREGAKYHDPRFAVPAAREPEAPPPRRKRGDVSKAIYAALKEHGARLKGSQSEKARQLTELQPEFEVETVRQLIGAQERADRREAKAKQKG
jgi:hypothetical protein